VAGVCQHIGLIEQIDACVPDTGRKVSVGQAVQAMVLNGLGFVGRALYLTPEFYRSKPLDLLIGADIEADDLNSDSLGKALDQLYAAGITEIFAIVSTYALRQYGIAVKFAHLDTTAFSLQGKYEGAENEDDGEPQPITITYGHSQRPPSRSETSHHGPDLCQPDLYTTQRYAQPGRPTSDSEVVTEWHIQATYVPDEQAIAQQQQALGKYIIATNELDPTRLSTADLLTVYKDQNTSVERGFRFLKDPLFFAHRLFLKKPARIMGLLMVMGLSLLIYALAG
jgi:transposase